jgi:hypothetical protein
LAKQGIAFTPMDNGFECPSNSSSQSFIRW